MQAETAPKPSLGAPEMRPFLVLWAGQLVSMLGSGLSGFALPVWVFQRTGSVEQFGLLMFAATVPGLVLSPLAGTLVDRWDRRRVIIGSDALSAAMTVVMALLIWRGDFQLWHLFAATAVASATSAFQEPAFAASLSLIVPREHYPRAAGLMQMASALTGLLAPVLAGVLVVTVGLEGVLLIDFATFLVAMVTLLAVRIPRPPREAVAEGAPKPSLLREAGAGWRYLRDRPGLLGLLLFFAVSNFALAFGNVLVQPMALRISTPAAVGAMASFAALGMLVGGAVVGARGGTKRAITGIAISGFGMAFGLAVTGLRPSIPLIALGLFFVLLMAPLGMASSQGIWMAKVPAEMQGRVFAIRRMVAISGAPVATLAAGPLAERVFEPWMATGGALAGVFGPVLGTGPGRGVGLLLLAMAVLLAAATAVMLAAPRVRNVEDEVPDAAHARPARPEPVPG